MHNCVLCNLENPPDNHYWKIHNLSQKEYYHNYFPRKNLLTGELLNFKNRDQYFLNDFNNRTELQNWLKTQSESQVFDYLCGYLEKRKKIKEIINFPCQLESKTLIFPSVLFLIKKYGISFVERLAQFTQLKLKYNYKQKLRFSNIKNNFYVDTREISPIKLDSFEIIKLDEGDYCAQNNPQNIFIDKKDFNDATGTLSKGYERFEREIQRAALNNKYLIMMIEAEFSDFSGIQYKKWVHSKASADFLFHRIRELIKFSNFQIVFVKNRENSKKFIEKVYNLENDIKTIDLFYHIENGDFEI